MSNIKNRDIKLPSVNRVGSFEAIKSGIVLSILLIFSTITFAQFTPTGSETVGNTTTTGAQQHPKIAADSSCNYVIVWESFGEDGDDYGIFAQRFLADGSKAGSQFQVNNTTVNGQRFPDVAMDETGNFMLTWMSENQDGDGWGVYSRLYDSSGTSILGPSRVNSSSTGQQKFPAVAMGENLIVIVYNDSDGDGSGIFLRVMNKSGVALAAPIHVNTTTSGVQSYPSVAIDPSDNFVVAWQDNTTDGDGNGIYLQRFDSSFNPVGTETLVNSTTAGNQQAPKVAKALNGNCIISWSGYNQDGDDYGVFAKVFNGSGVAISGETQINTEAAGAQENESVTALVDGNFVVSWSSYGQDGSFTGVYMQTLKEDGTVQGVEKQINTTTDNFQHFSDLAVSKSRMIATWQDGQYESTTTKDGDGYGISFQLYDITVSPVAVCQDLIVYLDTDGIAKLTAEEVDNGSSDDVLISSLNIDISSFTCSNVGDNLVTLTVTDSHTNEAQCTSNVTVEDTISPIVLTRNITV